MPSRTRDPSTTLLTLLSLLIAHSALLALAYTFLCLLSGAAIHPVSRIWDCQRCSWQADPEALRFGLAHLLSAGLTVPLLARLVKRSKLVLDFAMTTQAALVVLSWVSSGRFPFSASWWLLWLVSSAVLVFGAEWMCMRAELKPMTFGGRSTIHSGNHEEGDGAELEVLHEFIAEEEEDGDEEAAVGLHALRQQAQGKPVTPRQSMQGGRNSLQVPRQSFQSGRTSLQASRTDDDATAKEARTNAS